MWSISILVLIIGIIFGALHIDSVQTFLAKRLTAYISEQLKTKVTIDRVSIRFVKSVNLKGFYVEDLHGDTLVYADELNVSISELSTKNHQLDIGRLLLKKGLFNLKHYKGEVHDNLHFISEYFASSDTTTSSTPWNIKIEDLALRDFRFKNFDENDTVVTKGVDFSNLDVSGIYGDFSDYSTTGDSVFLNIRKLAFKDKCGFALSDFTSDIMFSPVELRLKNLVIRSPFTDIHTDLTFLYDSLACFDDFTSRIQWQTSFRNSTISFADIAYFAPDLTGIDKAVKLDGDFKGSVNNFKGKNVSLEWGVSSWFHGNVSMNGLPYINDTYMDIYAEGIKSNKSDIEWLPVPPFEQKKLIDVPDNMKELGDVLFKGKFTGFVSDFVAFGNVKTGLGSISSDLNVKYNKKKNISEYSGHLAASQFDVGKITGINDIGKVSFSVNLNGEGLQLDNINSKLDGKIDLLQFRNYDYKNIIVDGQLAKKLFNGSLTVDEPNVNLDFHGTIDYRSKLPEYNFIADIRTAHLDTLNLFNTQDRTILQTSITSHFKGNKLDNIIGGIEIKNTNLITGKKLFHINSITLNAEKTDAIRTFDILSDNFDAHFIGEFDFAKLGDAFKEIIPRYLPSVILPRKSFYSNQNFKFDIRIKNLNIFTETFLPNWQFAPNTTMKGHFNSVNYDISADINTAWIKYKEFGFDDFDMKLKAGSSELILDASAGRISRNDNDFIKLPTLTARAENNQLRYKLNLSNTDSATTKAYLEGIVSFNSSSDFLNKIDSSRFIVENNEWILDENNSVKFDSSTITLSSMTFSKKNESISLDGKISKIAGDKVGLSLSGFNLNNLNTFLKSDKSVFGGIVSGNVFLSDVYNQIQLESNIKITDFSIDNDTLGNADIISKYNVDQSVILGSVSIVKGSAKVVDISGNYYLSKENNNLDFSIKLNNLYLHPLERYISDIMTDVYGKVSADLKLTGNINKPVFNGTLDLNKTSLTVNYLQTHYSFSTRVKVRENVFELEAMKIVDVHNNEGIIRGKVFHDYFTNFRFDVELQSNGLQVLNTTINDNLLYYGIANASGYAHFSGPIDNMSMDISLSPEKGTVVNIPLNTYEDLSRNNYITFIDRSKDTAKAITRNNVDLSGVKLNMNLDLNRNAEINIIFDEKIGDVISGSGTGSLRLDINTAGNFNMYGTYTIEKGEYLFTLQNLINKKFSIDNGSRITWAGDPFEATVDLSAVYVVYTSTLYNILQDSSYKRRVPVDCRLFLKNKLMNPAISYEIGVRGIGPTEDGLLKTMLNSEQEINRQMFSLLIFGQFLPVAGNGQNVARLDAGSGAGASASELLSNQVSNWLGQISKDVNIGVNYRAKDTYTNEEVKLIFSKTFFNERLTFEGNVGYLGDQSYVNSNVVGDFYAEYKVSEDGRFRVKGFNRSNADNIISYSQSPYTQGLGFFYRQEFNSFSDLLVRWRLKNKKEEAPKE